MITYLGSWKEHYKFWTNDNENLLIIKYEDLVKNIHQEIDKIIAFLINYIDLEVSDTKKENIIKSTSFEALKKIEDNGDFTENVFVKGTYKVQLDLAIIGIHGTELSLIMN